MNQTVRQRAHIIEMEARQMHPAAGINALAARCAQLEARVVALAARCAQLEARVVALQAELAELRYDADRQAVGDRVIIDGTVG